MFFKGWYVNIHDLGTSDSSLSYCTCTLHSYVGTFYLGIRTSIRINMKWWHFSPENRKTLFGLEALPCVFPSDLEVEEHMII